MKFRGKGGMLELLEAHATSKKLRHKNPAFKKTPLQGATSNLLILYWIFCVFQFSQKNDLRGLRDASVSKEDYNK